MDKQYMKMSDAFDGKVKSGLTIIGPSIHGENHVLYAHTSNQRVSDYIVHAINSHDELVEQRDKMLKALKEAVDCGIVPSSSAKEGGAAKYARQVIVADMIREAIALVDGDKQ